MRLYCGSNNYARKMVTSSDIGIVKQFIDNSGKLLEYHIRIGTDDFVSVKFMDESLKIGIDEYEEKFGMFASVYCLNEENRVLKNRVLELENRVLELEYAPGGPKYEELERDFYTKARGEM